MTSESLLCQGQLLFFVNRAITARNGPFKRPSLVQVVLTVSKPGEKADVPVGVIVGSVIAGLLLLALAVGLLWKVRVCLCSIEQRRFACISIRKETRCSVCFLFVVWVLQEEVPAASARVGGRRR